MRYFISLGNQILLDKSVAFLCVCSRVKRETEMDERRESVARAVGLCWLLVIIKEKHSKYVCTLYFYMFLNLFLFFSHLLHPDHGFTSLLIS